MNSRRGNRRFRLRWSGRRTAEASPGSAFTTPTRLAACMVVVSALFTLSGCGGPSAEGPVVIGAVISATGPAAPLGEPQRNTLQLMEKTINEAGGVLGRELKIVIADDQSSAKEAVTGLNRLLQQEKAVAVIGATTSSSTLAIEPALNKAGVPQMALSAANAVTDEPPIDWLWRVAPKDNLAVARALKYVSEGLGAQRIAVLYDENAFGSSGWVEIERTQADWGLEVVASESYKTEETDLTAHLTKIKGADPEAVIVWGTNPGPAVAAKNMRQLGMTAPYVGSHGIANMKFIELAGEAGEGVVLPTNKMVCPEAIADPAMRETVGAFIEDYSGAYGQLPNPFAAYAHDALFILIQAIEAAGTTEAAALQTELDRIAGLVCVGGVFTYSPTDHDGLTLDDLLIVKIVNGTWVAVE